MEIVRTSSLIIFPPEGNETRPESFRLLSDATRVFGESLICCSVRFVLKSRSINYLDLKRKKVLREKSFTLLRYKFRWFLIFRC
jgi:hypothetical protein